MSNDVVKNQHMAPRFYLENFSNNNKLIVYDKHKLDIFPADIKSTGSERYFYDLIPGKYQTIEKVLNKEYEDTFSRFLYDFLRQVNNIEHFSLKQHQKEKLAKYMGFQYIRTRRFREESARIFTGKNLYEPVDIGLNLDYLHISLLANSYSLVRNIKKNMMDNYYWLIGINKTDEKFYTSDHPVVQRQSMNNIFETETEANFATLSDEISFPLSPEIVVMLFNKEQKVHRERRRLNKKRIPIYDLSVVNNLNNMQIMRSYRQVYSVDGNFDLAIRVEEETRQKLIDRGYDPSKILLPKWIVEKKMFN